MRRSVLTILKSLPFLALVTFTVQADFNDVSNTNNVSVGTEVEDLVFQGEFESTAIASFGTSPDSIVVGETTRISWSTINAETCVLSGEIDEWPDSSVEVEVPSGQLPLTISTAGTYPLTLTCENATIEDETINHDVKTIEVTVDEKPVVIVDFKATPDSILEGQSTVISWTVNDANSCTPTGDIDEWTNSSIEVPSGQLSLTISTAGTYSLTLTCENGTNQDGTENQDAKTIVITVDGKTVKTVEFKATPDTFVEGQGTIISWIVTDAISCLLSSDIDELPGSGLEVQVPSGELLLSIATAGTYPLTLTCENVPNQDGTENQTVETIEITVTEPAADCARTLPAGDELLWVDVFDAAWPGPKSRQVVPNIPRYSYISLEFNTGLVQDTGVVTNFEATATEGSRLFAISKCPGDFNVAPECREVSDAYQESIIWATTGAPGYCQLEPNTTYYWNTTFTDGVNPGSTECTGTYCLTTLRVWNRDYVE